MNLSVSAVTLVSLLMALVRTSAWVAVVPLFGGRTTPAIVKAGLAVALAVPMAPKVAAHAPSLGVASLLSATVVQAGAGLALGFVTLMLFTVFQTVGQFIDMFGGLSMSAYFDPLTMQQNSVFGRFHNMFALTLLFASGADLLVVHGMLSSFDAVPANANPLSGLARLFTSELGTFFVASLEVAGPLLAVLVLADVGLGLMTKAAPQLNVFSLGFPLKLIVCLVLVGTTLVAIPSALERIVDLITGDSGVAASLFAGH